MRKKTYYIVMNDGWGQHGTDIEEIKLTKEEYNAMKSNPNRNYFITDKYISALYYTQD